MPKPNDGPKKATPATQTSIFKSISTLTVALDEDAASSAEFISNSLGDAFQRDRVNRWIWMWSMHDKRAVLEHSGLRMLVERASGIKTCRDECIPLGRP